MLSNLDVNSQVSYRLVIPGVWSPLIVCKPTLVLWKYEGLFQTLLECKPRIFHAVSCLIENMSGFVQLFLNPNQEYFKRFHVSCLIENMSGSVRHFLNPNQEYFMWFHVWLKSQTHVTLFLNQWSMLVWHLKYEVCHQKIFLIFLNNISNNLFENIFIWPDSNHWLPLSLTLWCLVDLIDVTPAFEDTYFS